MSEQNAAPFDGGNTGTQFNTEDGRTSYPVSGILAGTLRLTDSHGVASHLHRVPQELLLDLIDQGRGSLKGRPVVWCQAGERVTFWPRPDDEYAVTEVFSWHRSAAPFKVRGPDDWNAS